MRIVLVPEGPFQLAPTAAFLTEWAGGRDDGAPAGRPRLLAVRDDLAGGLAAELSQRDDGALVAEVAGADDQAATGRQLARALGLDRDASGLAEIAARDPVVADALARAPGFRPVSFGTPYEAAAWALMSQRTSMAQAGAAWRRLAEALGTPLQLGGQTVRTFPIPGALLAGPLPRLRTVVAERLRGLATVALDGALDAERLRALPSDEALAQLRRIPGIGPFSAGLILLRGCAVTDVLATEEPRLRAIVGRRYGIGADDDAALAAVAEGWHPYRTWIAVLLRSQV